MEGWPLPAINANIAELFCTTKWRLPGYIPMVAHVERGETGAFQFMA
jgi:hypothetical protein